MKLQINGEERTFDSSPSTIAALVELLGMKADRVAIELNRDIVPRDRWADTTLHAGSHGTANGTHDCKVRGFPVSSCTGTCSTISMPKPSRAATFFGRFVSRRMRRRLRSDNI